jgi:deoxyribodipyrimidine photo-lyase
MRLEDNPSLFYAYHNFDRVVPVLVIPTEANTHQRGVSQDMGVFRRQFLLESIDELQFELLKLGIDLILLEENEHLPSQLEEICTYHKIDQTVTSYPRGMYAQDLLGVLCQYTAVYTCEDDTLFEKDSLPFSLDKLPKSYTSFRKKVEKNMEVRQACATAPWSSYENKQKFGITIQVPSIEKDERSAYPFKGGVASAKERLYFYLWESAAVATYKETRNGMIGTDFSTKFSAFLALGNISPVQIYEAVKDFEANQVKNESTYWVIFELLWREFFYWVAEKHGKKIFLKGGLYIAPEGSAQSDTDNGYKKFEKWCKGETFHAFINANMKELVATGYMSNRGRQNVASYLIHHLKVDWRWGAAFFEKHLIDYDVCNNWCNWMYLAGVGNDPRSRVFNPDKQQSRYDPNGDYISLWEG